MTTKTLRIALCTVVFAFACGTADAAGPQQAKVEAAAKSLIQKQIKSWIANPVVINAIKAQNAKHASITDADIQKMDKQWRAETKASAKPMIEAVLSNELSKFLKKVKNDGAGLYTEIFVMDNKGLNVGQSDVTSDYWQGDEGKWKKTYLVGPHAVFVDEVEMDESTQTFQSQINVSIADPATNQVIGAITIGVDAEQLLN